jgi:hypothetical protein
MRVAVEPAGLGRWLVKAHAYPFYVLRSTFKTVSTDGLEDWKALLVISVAMNFAAITVASIVSIAFQQRVLLPDTKQSFLMLWGTVIVGLLLINHYSLVYRGKWSQFEKEFQHLSKAARVGGSIAVWVSLILIVAAAEWTGSIAWKLPP